VCRIRKALFWIGTVLLAALVGLAVGVLVAAKRFCKVRVDVGRLKELEKDLERLKEEERQIERKAKWFDDADEAARYLENLLQKLKKER